MNWIDAFLGVGSWLRRQIGMSQREWAEWAAGDPMAAAELLDRQASRLEGLAAGLRVRADMASTRVGRRVKIGRAERLGVWAEGLRGQARDLRRRASGGTCYDDPTRAPWRL